MKIRTFIVDDESLSRQRLKDLLAAHDDVEVVGEYPSGTAAKAALPFRTPDLMLLDVQMPKMDGLKLAHLLAENPLPLVVFVTAHESFAVEAFDTRAVDYLLKPIRPERLTRAMTRVRDQLSVMQGFESPIVAAAQPSGDSKISRLMARSGDRIVFINAKDIDWIESAGNYVVVSAGTERHIIRETMAALEKQLSSDEFVRLNRSLIVNAERIVELEVQAPGEYVAILKDKKRAAVTIGLRNLENRLRFNH